MTNISIKHIDEISRVLQIKNKMAQGHKTSFQERQIVNIYNKRNKKQKTKVHYLLRSRKKKGNQKRKRKTN